MQASLLIAALSVSSLVGMVQGHGFVSSMTVGGVTYEASQPFQDQFKNPVPQRVNRAITDNSVRSSASLLCGTADLDL